MKNASRFFMLLLIAGLCILWPLQGTSAAIQRSYVSLGDSIAFGLWALPGEGYVPLYAGYLQSDLSTPIALTPLGVLGWTSGDLLNALRTNFLFRISIFFSDVVTWNIGGNDLRAARTQYKGGTCGGADNQDCLRGAVQTLKTNWDGILNEIFALRRFRPTIIRTMDIYNPYVDEDQVDTWPNDGGNDFKILNGYLDQVNNYIASTSAARHIGFAPVHLWFNGVDGTSDPAKYNLLAFDGFHPSTAGHVLIALLLRQQGYLPVIP